MKIALIIIIALLFIGAVIDTFIIMAMSVINRMSEEEFNDDESSL